jgi:hypothetical protein
MEGGEYYTFTSGAAKPLYLPEERARVTLKRRHVRRNAQMVGHPDVIPFDVLSAFWWPQPSGVVQKHAMSVMRQLERACSTSEWPVIRKKPRGQAVVLVETGSGEPVRPYHDSHYFHFDRTFPELFHATSDTRAAACHNLVATGVEDLKRNRIGEFVAVVTDVDGPREPMRLYPGSSGAKNEGLGYCAIRVAVGVLPDTQNCSA